MKNYSMKHVRLLLVATASVALFAAIGASTVSARTLVSPAERSHLESATDGPEAPGRWVRPIMSSS